MGTSTAGSNAVRTTCPYCGVGCGVIVQANENDSSGWSVCGDPDHPANRGRLCSKGLALGATMGDEDRVLHPSLAGRQVSWDTALDHTADTLRRLVDAHGPDSVAFYVSGQLLTEDYYVANKLMKGFIGSANIDTNSRLCMASAVAGHKRAFGADAVANCYEDLEQTDLLILVGSNLAWCHPVLYRRIEEAREKGTLRLVVIDPRATPSARDADLHLPIAPGADGFLFNGLLTHLAAAGTLDRSYIEQHTTGFDEALAAARAQCPDLAAVAAHCHVPEGDLATLFQWFIDTPRTLTLFSQGINQSASGTDKVNAIINTHLATGRIGRPGAGAFSITGQPNAMGGREVGGLANTLAAHMDFTEENCSRVGAFWNASRMATGPGLKAVDLFDAVHDGRVRAVWIMATNPIVSMPDGARVREALARCEHVIVSETFSDAATLAYADVVLPAAAWGEKDGTVTNSERCISRQRPVRPAPGSARPDWWIISEVARRMGHGDAFPYQLPAEIFDEHAHLTTVGNDGRRALDLGGLRHLTPSDYNAFRPVQWPVRANGKSTARLMGDGRAYFEDGKARFVRVTAQAPQRAPQDEAGAFVLNTGRVRDHWHTMTRTGRAAQLTQHIPAPHLSVHPHDAKRLQVEDGDLVALRNSRGQAVLEVTLDDGQRPGEVFAPIHWNEANAASADVGRLIAPFTDPHSGQPQFKYSRISVKPLPMVYWMRVGARHATVAHLDHLLASADYWTRRTTAYGQEWLIATRQAIPPVTVARLGEDGSPEEAHRQVSFFDEGTGLARYTIADDHGVRLVISMSPVRSTPQLLSADAMTRIFASESPQPVAMVGGLAGPAVTTVCACHGVTQDDLEEAIGAGADDLSTLGNVTAAGTGCGSCRPELAALLRAATASA